MKKNISFSHMPIQIVVTETKSKPFHYHPDVLELLFVLEGRLAITMEQESHFVNAGEFIAVNPGQPHSIHGKKICAVAALYFNINEYTKLFPHLPGIRFCCSRAQLSPEQLPYWSTLRNDFIRLMLMYNKNTPPAQEIMRDLAEKIMRMLWLRFQVRRNIAEQNLARYYNVSTFLHNHFHESISVAEVARRENISATRLAHFWKDATGFSIRQSVTRLRLAEAEKMLLETSLAINEIAYQCGFSDEKYFYQHFKARYKTTPNEYRIRCLEERIPTIHSILPKGESERRIAAYSIRNYSSDAPYVFPETPLEEVQKEQTLRRLYNAILTNPKIIFKSIPMIRQKIGCMHISPDKALFRRGNKYQINWEYVYAQMHIFIDFGLMSILLVDYDCMKIEEWKPLLLTLVGELRNVWGKSTVEEQQYIIYSSIITTYLDCIELVRYLQERTNIRNARTIYML